MKALNISFKNNRNYLHGSDLYNTISRNITDLRGESKYYIQSLVIRKFAKKLCAFTEELPKDKDKIVSNITICSTIDDTCFDAWIIETDMPVKNRYFCDENSFIKNAIVLPEKRIVTTSYVQACSIIECIIALTKTLNNTIEPNVKGKWLFGQLELIRPLVDIYQCLEVKMKSMIAKRYSINQIKIDEEDYGTIRFIAGDPS